MNRSFELASMSPLIRGFTIALWVLPVFLGISALVSREGFLGVIAFLLLVLYGSVWLGCRPSRFVVTSNYLKIVFPIWQRKIPLQDVSSIRLIDRNTFQREFGWAVRIGVGGLWGGFGWLWTSRCGFLEFYISQINEFVLIERLTGKSLLITPSHPQQLVATVQEMLD